MEGQMASELELGKEGLRAPEKVGEHEAKVRGRTGLCWRQRGSF